VTGQRQGTEKQGADDERGEDQVNDDILASPPTHAAEDEP
jgi:hypothetical protein